jgi:hypothetical protein
MYRRPMSKTNPLDALVAELAPVRDPEVAGAMRSTEALALLESLLDSPVRTPSRARRRVVAFAAAATVAAVLSIPALGLGPEIVSLFAGWHDPDAPTPSASDVLIASGEAGARWRLVATKSDYGLCLGLFHRAGEDLFGSAGCGYRDIRGDLPSELRGDPASSCIAIATGPLVPCGSLPKHWIGPVGVVGGQAGLDRVFAFGPLAIEVARVDLLLTGGRTVAANVVERPDGLPLNVYWASWPVGREGSDLRMAVAFDSSGRVLEQRVPAWNGNPTGDPDGPPPPEPLGE